MSHFECNEIDKNSSLSVLTFANNVLKNRNTSQQNKSSTVNTQAGQGSKHVLISDVRKHEDFAGITFSMYKRSQVKKSLVEAMNKCAIEEANYWTAEFICCGCFIELWEIILEFMGRNINTSNPKLPVIISKCFQDFKEMAMNEYLTNQLDMRNDQKIRRLMAKVVSILCTSRKKSKMEYVKIDKENDFDILKLSSRLKAPSTDYGKNVLKSEDPTEVYVAINELCYHISKDVRNALMSQYWIEWILEFDNKCRKKKERCQCIRREFAPQDDENGKDIVFLIWDAILTEAKSRPQKIITTILINLLDLFKMRFTSGTKKRRRHLLYFSISLLCEPLDLNIGVIQGEKALISVLGNIDIIYAQVKQNEITNPELIPPNVNKIAKEQTKPKKPLTEKEEKAKHKLNILTTMGMEQ